MHFRLELRNRLFYGDAISGIQGFTQFLDRDNGWLDMTWNLIEGENLVLNTTIDRALVRYNKGKWDITLGRQRINWGKNLIWNPNDIFNSYNFLDFDYEERPGSDALRIQYYTGDFNRIEMAVKQGRTPDELIAALLYGFKRGSYDLQIMAGIYENDWIIGSGWAGYIRNMGFKGEVTYFVPRFSYTNSRNILSTSLSADYGFKNGLYLNIAGLYNTLASSYEGSLEDLPLNFITAKNLMPFEFSTYLQLAKDFSPILSGAFNTVYSPTNHSVIAMPTLKYSISTNWEADLITQSFFELKNSNTLGHRIYLRVRWSF